MNQWRNFQALFILFFNISISGFWILQGNPWQRAIHNLKSEVKEPARGGGDIYYEISWGHFLNFFALFHSKQDQVKTLKTSSPTSAWKKRTFGNITTIEWFISLQTRSYVSPKLYYYNYYYLVGPFSHGTKIGPWSQDSEGPFPPRVSVLQLQLNPTVRVCVQNGVHVSEWPYHQCHVSTMIDWRKSVCSVPSWNPFTLPIGNSKNDTWVLWIYIYIWLLECKLELEKRFHHHYLMRASSKFG